MRFRDQLHKLGAVVVAIHDTVTRSQARHVVLVKVADMIVAAQQIPVGGDCGGKMQSRARRERQRTMDGRLHGGLRGWDSHGVNAGDDRMGSGHLHEKTCAPAWADSIHTPAPA